MKKLVLIFTALSLFLGLAGCGKRGTPAETTAPASPTQSAGATAPAGPTGPAGLVGPTGQTEPAQPETPIKAPHFTREEFPRLDGSTSTAPLAVAMTALMLGESEEDVTGLIHFSRTTNSYYNLLYGSADLLIVSEGNEEVYAERERMGFEWEQTPFAIDAFVFVVNEANPVDSLTLDEIRGIYTGRITNWSELGGADEPIIPLQRNPEAGSQSLMEKLVMQGTPMMEAPKEYVAGSMGGLMEAVRGYDASAGAIGYSVYYYAEEMRAAKGLKLLSVEGVSPEPDAIRDGSYPLTNPYYTVIPASAPENSPARIIRDWLLSEDGQRLAAQEGYVSVMDLPTAPQETKPAVGSRLFEAYTDEFTPGDYGLLIPYTGLRVSDIEFASSGCLYGLMTPAGQVVVDPVYAGFWYCGDLLVLNRVMDGVEYAAAVERSGKWWTGFEYLGATGGDEGVILYKKDSVTCLRPNGESAGTFTAGEMGLSEEQLRLMRYGPMEGGGGEWLGDKISVAYNFDGESTVTYFDLTERALKKMGVEEWSELYPADETEEPVLEGAWYIYDDALGRDAPAILGYMDPDDGTNSTSFRYEDGAPIPGLAPIGITSTQSVRLLGGLIERVDLNVAEYFDMNTMKVVFRTYLGYDGD